MLNDGPMTDSELATALAEEERAAVTFRDSALAQEQENAIDFYEAEPFGDEEDGRSQIVAPVVAEVVDYMTISVLRTCVSGDRVVEFEPKKPGQHQAAEEATEAVTWAFMRGQDGYKVLHDWVQSGLIEKIGVVKTACIKERRNRREQLTVDAEQLAMLDVEGTLLDYAENGDGTFVARVQYPEVIKRYVDMPIPSEEFLFSPRTRHEDESYYIAHKCRKTLSDLIEMGFDPEVVEGLPTGSRSYYDDSRDYTRWQDEYDAWVTRRGAMREVLLLEEYVRIDRDGDGIAELLKVFRVDNTILEVEEVDEQPFVVFTPFPRAHRMVGNSLADKVMDIQRTKSVIMRQTLDGLYLSNRPRATIDEGGIGDNTIDDWLTPGPGVLIRVKSGGEIKPLADAFDVTRGLAMLEFVTGEQESRTGITRLNQGLDADALNKTATGTALMQAQGQQMEEYVARTFAEAVARLFGKKLRLMRAEGDPVTVRLDGEIKQVDPTGWDPDMDVSIRVGLGSGRKEQRLLYRQQLFEALGAIAVQFPRLVDEQKAFNLVSGFVKDTALGLPTDFVNDPDQMEPEEPKPDPAMVEAEAKALIEAEKVEQARQQAQMQAMLKKQETDAKIMLMREEAAAKLELEAAKAESEQRMNMERMAFEQDMAERQFEVETEIALASALVV